MIFADSITLVPDVEVIAQDIRGERRYDLVRYSFGANVTYIISITGSDGSATECFGGDGDETGGQRLKQGVEMILTCRR